LILGKGFEGREWVNLDPDLARETQIQAVEVTAATEFLTTNDFVKKETKSTVTSPTDRVAGHLESFASPI
jgi:hypothetical protein